jgi:transketolase
VFTHDSIGLGEDGPTHQPIEHLASLRAIPNLAVIRPGDANETAEAWKAALSNTNGPTALSLTRQGLPTLDRSTLAAADGLQRGGYILKDPEQGPVRLIVIASGSEVDIALNAASQLSERNIAVRVVSMPCWELFDAQPDDYRRQVLPPEIPVRVAIEAGSPQGWSRYVGSAGAVIGLDHFGASAPYGVLYQKFGITVENVVEKAMALLA